MVANGKGQGGVEVLITLASCVDQACPDRPDIAAARFIFSRADNCCAAQDCSWAYVVNSTTELIIIPNFHLWAIIKFLAHIERWFTLFESSSALSLRSEYRSTR